LFGRSSVGLEGDLLAGGEEMSDQPGRVPHMGRKSLFDHEALVVLLLKQNGVLTRDQARDCGMSRHALEHRVGVDGPWQPLLPGVYMTNTGTPTRLERLQAALLYAGPGSAITAPAALTLHHIRVRQILVVDVLIPQERKRRSLEFVRVHRTSRMPGSLFRMGEVSYVSLARAVADTVGGLRDISEVRAIVAEGVQRGRVQVPQLADELAQGPVQGSARFRRVLAEVAEGVRSAAEGDLRSLIKRERLPEPMYNARLYAGDSFIAMPDAWWPDAEVAVEIESRQWHLSPGDWDATLARDARMSARGIIVLHFSPRRLRTEPAAVASEIRSALEAGLQRGRLGIRAVAC
jgi:very-short-patch-repair endonuclease